MTRTSRLRAALVGAAVTTLAATGALLVPSGAPAAERGVTDPAAAPPPGANDFSCRPTRRHPFPVVLVPGTFESRLKNWSTLSPVLADAGYCVFALNYGETNGVYATGPIQRSAEELDAFVNKVLRRTDTRKVVIVGHSQGGMMPRQYMRFEGGRTKVRSLVGIAPSNHGTQGLITPSPDGTTPPASGDSCRACDQQQAGSRFLKRLNRDGDLVHADHRRRQGPFYTVISTRYDEVVTPYRSQFLSGPARRVTNIVIQDVCPADPIEHDQAPNDPVVHQLVLEALSHERAPADPTPSIDCTTALN
jgi:triacylglycerol lipase